MKWCPDYIHDGPALFAHTYKDVCTSFTESLEKEIEMEVWIAEKKLDVPYVGRLSTSKSRCCWREVIEGRSPQQLTRHLQGETNKLAR